MSQSHTDLTSQKFTPNPKNQPNNNMNWITENYVTLLAVLGSLYGVASLVATLTPSDKDDSFLEKVGKWADRIGLNLKGK
jgi:hypothetical protein